MPNRVNDAFRFAARETPRVVAAPDENCAEPRHNQVSSALAILQRKLSSRLARHVALKRRRLVNSGPMVSFTFDDAATSAGLRGAEGLEKMRGRGTYYIASGLIGRNVCRYAADGSRQRARTPPQGARNRPSRPRSPGSGLALPRRSFTTTCRKTGNGWRPLTKASGPQISPIPMDLPHSPASASYPDLWRLAEASRPA